MCRNVKLFGLREIQLRRIRILLRGKEILLRENGIIYHRYKLVNRAEEIILRGNIKYCEGKKK